MHAASLGECKGLWALAQTLSDLPVSFVLTTNTTTGLDFLSRQIEAVEDPKRWRAVLAPFDHPSVVQRFVQHFQIKSLLLFEVELWPHFILTLHQQNKPVFWVSARMTPKARKRYGRFPETTRSLLGMLNWVQAQSEKEAAVLRKLGCKNVEVGSDLRGLHYLHSHTYEKTGMNSLNWNDRKGICFLSLHADELAAVLPAIQILCPQNPLFVFPRKMEELDRFKNRLIPLGFVLHSQNPNALLILVDAFGHVPEYLKRCHTTVIGGSFSPYGGHNLWEPLVAGTSMVIGPQHWNQNYLVHKLEKAGLLRISNKSLNAEILQKPETDPGHACREFMEREKQISVRRNAHRVARRAYRDER